MANEQTPDLYETYIRTADGATYHPSNFRDAIDTFLSRAGYRISFNIEGVVITLRKNTSVDDQMKFLDENLNQDSVECAVTIRGHK